MSDLVGNPEDRFSGVAAHMILNPLSSITCIRILVSVHDVLVREIKGEEDIKRIV